MEAHKQAVATIASAVRQYFARREPYRIFHGSTNSTRPRTHNRAVDISALGHVLSVDTEKKTCLVEPNVPMDRLVAATLPHGLVPPVVMEFPGITAGGGYAGTAGESSSFRHGFFDETINRVEMVLANGDVVEATPQPDDTRRDLFRGAAGALGTLGITTLMELQLVPARKYVKTTYHRRSSVGATVRLIKELADAKTQRADYVDGIVFSKDHGVVVTGEMTDEKPADAAVQTFSHARDPWFYLHVQDKTKTKTAADTDTVTEYIPLAEYLFRYDRGGFWVARSAFAYFPFPFNRWTRWFLDDFCKTRMLYKALHASGQSSTYIVQDLALPYASAEAFVDYTAETFGIWPLWLCPLKPAAKPTFHPHATGPHESDAAEKQMLNIGLWGQGPASVAACVELNKDLEHKLASDFGGMKWFYAHAYYEQDAFWRIYDRPAYEALRLKYNATTLPSVYDKIKVNTDKAAMARTFKTTWPFAAFFGLQHAIASKAYLPRTPPWRK
ncbi:fad binding domain-containing protein [Ophiostoma piceae UAMH 11346]|uniref:Delta(24)-sterol reductase n=1 Tax=Ophiostoma piceae (strain UAMH 11346) TaxID=1262450 RepID=S3D7C9_OPHP1|nr:fad binding domain-containing protein [Ophiostoma piceae UAMH 11346]